MPGFPPPGGWPGPGGFPDPFEAARPPVPAVTEDLYDELKVTQPGDDQRGWPLLLTLGGIGTVFGRLHDIVRDSDAGLGWTSLLDPTRCPVWALPWLAQFAGVADQVALTTEEAQQRRLITSTTSFLRGTRQGMKLAVGATLTGEQVVRIVENVDDNPYLLAVVTDPAETPNPAATTAAAVAQKPIGMLLATYVSATPLLMEYTRNLADVTVDLGDATLSDVT